MQEAVKELATTTGDNYLLRWRPGRPGRNKTRKRNSKPNKTRDVKITAVATPQKEDINSLYVKYDKDCLLQLINERKPVNEDFFFN